MKKVFLIILFFAGYFSIMAQNIANKTEIIEHVDFGGWSNCIKLSNGNIELIVTTDVGPRIVRFGFVNGSNIFYVDPVSKGKTGGDEWCLYGGHRFWLAPEVRPLTYVPDNANIKYSWNYKTLKISQNIDPEISIVKELEITMYPDRNEVEVLHRVINKEKNDIEVAPWAISACAAGGRAIVPQEPYIDPADYLLPIRPVVLWAYTKMNDPRYNWGAKFIIARQDSSIDSETKIGVLNKQQWAAYYLSNCLFIKTFEYDPNVIYPDYGCNNEIYINGNFLEIESLGPLKSIMPNESVVHRERWILSKTRLNIENEISLEKSMLNELRLIFH